MPYLMLGRERFALPIGETRIGGAGDDALPFPELARLTTAAILLVTAEDVVSLWPSHAGSERVTVNGVALGAEPVELSHGARIELAGVRLLFGDLRQFGTTDRVNSVTDDQIALLRSDGPSEPTTDSGGRLIAGSGGAVVTVPDSGCVAGRDPGCDVVVAGMGVSRRHAVIRPSIQGYVLTDLSTNGTYVNGGRIDGTRVLGMGDVIRIGDEEFRFEADPGSYEPSPHLASDGAPASLTSGPSSEPPTMPLRSAARLLATLEIMTRGPSEGTRFRIERPVVHIGRAQHNDVCLTDVSVSAVHATLTRRRSTWVAFDHDSTNGTYVDGERIRAEHALSGVTELRFGNVKMLFRPIAGDSDDNATSTRAVGVPLGLPQKRRR
jgi:pSer/pThr/pTyr-binding forkhead associated (FHA) protein